MTDHHGFVVEVKNLRPHSNADRLQIATFFGNDTCVSTDVKIGDIGIYFPSDLQLDLEYCIQNHLLRKLPDGTKDNGYLDDNRHISAIRLRGERSDGIYMPLKSLEYTGINLNELSVGDFVEEINGHKICQKYIPKYSVRSNQSFGNNSGKTRKSKDIETSPYFVEHIDTPQLKYNMSLFKPGDVICLTEKVHGTSSRNAHTLVIGYKRNILDKIFHRKGKEVKSYKYLIGTRRTTVNGTEGGYYGSNQFRIDWGENFRGKLYEGEEVFGEIAGFTHDGTPIMGVVSNKKTNDKEFIKRYGENTCFSYGCNPNGSKKMWGNDGEPFSIDIAVPKSRYFIYRMTYTAPDGRVIEYPWDMVRQRAEELGFETVPELDRFIYTTEEDFMARINKWLDIPSTIDDHHVIEGVVVRALNATGFRVAKIKSFNFQVIEGIMKNDASAPDIEEAEEVIEME